MTDIETLLRTEFADRAADATGADAILAALAEQRPRRPTFAAGRWTAVAAGVVLIAAGIPLGLSLTGGYDPTRDPTVPPAAAPNGYVLHFDPAWLPAGFVEVHRANGPDDAREERAWSATPVTGQSPRVALTAFGATSEIGTDLLNQLTKATHTVTLRGHRTAIIDDQTPTDAELTWQPDPHTVLQLDLTGLPEALATAERIATWVMPNSSATANAGLAFGTLPAGCRTFTAGVSGGSSGTATRYLYAGVESNGEQLQTLTLQLTPANQPPQPPSGPASSVSVLGRTGSYVAATPASAAYLTVQLADGDWLTLVNTPQPDARRPALPELTRAQLVEIADNVTIDNNLDLSWIH